MSKYTIYRDLWGWKFHILIIGGAGMKAGDLKRIIDKKKRELVQLVAKKQSFLDQEVYAKSCELDSLVVRYMKLKLSNK